MMHIRVMRMRMYQHVMAVPMGVRFSRRIIRPVSMLVVLIMEVTVLMLHGFMPVQMLMPLRQVQPNTNPH